MALSQVCQEFLRRIPTGAIRPGELYMLHISTFESDQSPFGKGINIHYCGNQDFRYEKVNETSTGDRTTTFKALFSVVQIEKAIREHLGKADFIRMIIHGDVVSETDL